MLALLWATQAFGFADATLRDAFDRADGALGANWTNLIISTDASTLVVVSNGVSREATAGSGSAHWTGATFGPNVKVSLDTPDATVPSTASLFIYLRLTSPGVASATDGYACQFSPFTTTVNVLRIDNSSSTTLNTNAAAPLADGGKVGCEVIGNTITAYVDTGSGYVAVATAADGTYPAGGSAGLRANATTLRADNFGAQTIIPVVTRPPLFFH